MTLVVTRPDARTSTHAAPGRMLNRTSRCTRIPALCLRRLTDRARAYDQAMNKARSRLTLPIAPVGKAIVPDRVQWLRAEMLKTRVAHGYCSRNLVAEACSYANICEQCDNFTTSTEFVPALQAQLSDVTELHEDAQARGWNTEVARHARVITSITRHLDRLSHTPPPPATT